jgi:hypothetical protein
VLSYILIGFVAVMVLFLLWPSKPSGAEAWTI